MCDERSISPKGVRQIYSRLGDGIMESDPVSDVEFDAQMRQAEERSRRTRQEDPRAISARYERKTRRVVVDLSNGCAFAFPVDLAEGLRTADAEQLEDVEVSSAGFSLHWEALDVDFTVAGLMRGIFGTRRWMAELGRLGGTATSDAKARAARRNGVRGGRPRKA
jgi:hypothetical protein